MEAQPIALALLFVSLLNTSSLDSNAQIAPWVLSSGTITLLLLGLHWWTLLIENALPQAWSTRQKQFIHLLGPGLAIIIMAFFVDIPDLIPVGIFILLFWRLAIFHTQRAYRDERLVMAFRTGFIVLLVVLICAFTTSVPAIVFAALAQGLPIFFLSGLIALSFTRLSIINQENARLPGAAQANSTRAWFIILTCLWGLIVAASFLLETFTFSLLQTIFQPIWYLLGLITYWLLFLIFAFSSLLVSLFGLPRNITFPPFSQQSVAHPLPSQIQHNPVFSSLIFLIARLFILALAVILLVIVIRAILRSLLAKHYDDVEEEIREGLALRTILAERRQQQRQQEQTIPPEALDPLSARARYREFLQTVAQSSPPLARHPEETPLEYQQRLLTHLAQQASPGEENATSDPAQLRELTSAYLQERYASGASSAKHALDFKAWLQRFVQRLKGHAGAG
jgi:hypothetical protein